MALRGKKHTEETKRKALALLAVSPSVEQAAREFGIPRTTLMTWKVQGERLASKAALLRALPIRSETEYEIRCEPEKEVLILHGKRREEFAEKTWEMLTDSLTLTHNRIKRALEKEKELDELLDEIKSKPKDEMSGTEKQAAIVKIRSLQLHTLRELSSFISTLYEKQAMALGEKGLLPMGKRTESKDGVGEKLSDADRSLLEKVEKLLEERGPA